MGYTKEPATGMGCLLALGGGAGYAARRSRPSLIAGFTLGSAFAACGMAIGTPHFPSAAHPAAPAWLLAGPQNAWRCRLPVADRLAPRLHRRNAALRPDHRHHGLPGAAQQEAGPVSRAPPQTRPACAMERERKSVLDNFTTRSLCQPTSFVCFRAGGAGRRQHEARLQRSLPAQPGVLRQPLEYQLDARRCHRRGGGSIDGVSCPGLAL